MAKRLIYPLEYFADVTYMKNEELNTVEEVLAGIFLGMDVKTGEEVLTNTFQKETTLTDEADFFKENDVLYMDYGQLGMFCVARIADRKESFDYIQRFYKSLKSDGISEDEINNKMMRKFNIKKVETKRLYK